jgi:hypothetical protein
VLKKKNKEEKKKKKNLLIAQYTYRFYTKLKTTKKKKLKYSKLYIIELK